MYKFFTLLSKKVPQWLTLFVLFLGLNQAVNAQQVVVGATTSTTVLSYSATQTFSHTVAAGDRRLLIVGITQNRNSGNGVNGVTYNSTAMTLVGRRQYGGNGGNTVNRGWVHIYRLVNPPVGTANVVISFGEADDRGFTAGATNFTNVNQINPTNTFATVEGDNISTATLSNIPSVSNQLVYSVLTSRDRNITGVGSGQTSLWNLNSNPNQDDRNTGAGSVKTSTGANQSVSYTRTNQDREWIIGAVSIIPDPFSASGVITDATCPSGANGAISITVNGGVGPFTYSWSNGATTQNISGLSANTYTVTVTGSNSATTTTSFTVGGPTSLTDTDGDGVIDNCDLDDDNDGILDSVECQGGNTLLQETTFAAVDGNAVSFPLDPITNQIVVDVTRLDNSFNLNLNGTPITNQEIQYQNSGGVTQNIRFQDGTNYEDGTISPIFTVGGTGTNVNTPLIRVVINSNGVVSFFGSKVFNGPLFPMELFGGAVVNSYVFNNNAAVNTFVVDQSVVGPTNINGRVSGRLIQAPNGDVDGDGLINCLDTDSDNDGCPDAIEGSATNVLASNVNASGRITGGVDSNGVPTLVTGGQASNTAVVTAERITVTTAPVNQNVAVGNNATFSVTAAGVRTTTWNTTAPFAPNYTVPPGVNSTSTLVYRWFKNTAPTITLSSTSSLVLTSVQNASAGDYTVQISGTNRAGCPEERIATLAVINPVTESGTSPATGGTAVSNVRSNDFVNGIEATSSNSTITQSGTWATGISLNTTTGAISVANGTPPGTYSVAYQLCDLASPTANCATVTNSITVTAVINPVTESGTVPFTGGTAISDVRSNDFVNGIAATSSNSTITQNGTWATGITLNTTTGAITVANGSLVAGVYLVKYQLCDLAAPTPNCAIIENSITVNPRIQSNPDSNAGLINQTIAGNVGTNDIVPTGTTYETAVAVGTNPSAAVPSINIDGTYTITTAIPGVYSFNIPVCVLGEPTPCPTQALVITVADPSINTNTPVAVVDIVTSGFNTAIFVDVRSNDSAVNPGNTLSIPAIVTAPSNGTATVNSVSGIITYTPANGFVGQDIVTYQVCETTGGICATASIIITVNPANAINSTVAVDDYATTTGTTTTTGNVLTNDADPENNVQTVIAQGTEASPITIAGKGTYFINTDGTYSFTAEAGFTGSVDLPYTICDNGTPSACSSGTLYIVVKTICYEDANSSSVNVSPTPKGISLLKRAEIGDGIWPGVRNSAFLAIESNRKGFVVTRMTSDPAQIGAANYIANITTPQEGMIIYDMFTNCLKLYDGVQWDCFTTPACP